MIRKMVNYLVTILCSVNTISSAAPPTQANDIDILRSFENTISKNCRAKQTCCCQHYRRKTFIQTIKRKTFNRRGIWLYI